MLIKNQQFNLTIKTRSTGDATICGYASVYGETDNDNEIVCFGAFAEVENREVKLLWQHDQSKPIGVITKIKEDNYGLYIEADINIKTQYGQEAVALIEQGAVNGLSIGFKIINSKYDKEGIRNILSAELYEISVVTFPANEKASIHQIGHGLDRAIAAIEQF